MKNIDWDKVYGPQTEAFHNAVVGALQQEEKPMKRKRLSMGLVAAIILIAVAATALAVANRAGVLDFFASWTARNIDFVPSKITHELSGEEPLMQATFGDLLVTVTEAAGAGHDYYFTTTVELQPGISGMLVALDTVHFEGLGPVKSEDGVPVYYVRSHMLHEERYADMGDWQANEDGSLSILSYLPIDEPADTAQMHCYVTYTKAATGETPDETAAQTIFLSFEIPMPAPLDARKLSEPVAFDDLGIAIDELYFMRTGDAVSCHLFFRYEGGASVGYKLPAGNHGLSIRLLNTDGNVISKGLYASWRYDTLWYGVNALADAEMPEVVLLQIVDNDSEAVLASTTVSLTSGKPDPQMLAAYRQNPTRLWDYRDMYFPWSDMSFVTDDAYVSTDDPTGAPVYLDPRDPTTLAGYCYSGLLVHPNITYGDWTSIQYGMHNGSETKGYIRTDQLVRNAQDAVPGLILAHGRDGLPVYIAPDAGSTVCAYVPENEDIYVVGDRNEWHQIAVEKAGWLTVVGYVPANTLMRTDTLSVMW